MNATPYLSLLLLLVGGAALAAEPRVLFDTTFGQRYEPVTGYEGASGLLHEGWEENSSWAKAKLRYAVERLTEELSAQRVTLDDPGTGMGQLRSLSNFSIEAGRYYEIFISLKGEKAQKVGVALRNWKAPYKPITLRKDFTIGNEWKTWRFVEKAEEATEARLFLYFHERGTVLINRLTLRVWDEAPPAAASSVRKGNLLVNGDFRLGPYGWSSFGDPPRDPVNVPRETMLRYSVDPPALFEEAPGGLGLQLTPETQSSLVSTMVAAAGRRPFTATARVRRSEGEGPVQFRLFSPHWSKPPTLEKPVGTEWQTLRLEGEFPDREPLAVRAELRAGGKGRLVLSEVVLQQEAAAPTPSFGVIPAKGLPLYPLGTPVELSLRHSGATGSNVDWTLVDSQGRPTASGRWVLTSAAQTHRLDKVAACGWYQLRWRAPWAQDPQGRTSFGVVPPVGRRAGERSPFGIHVEGSALGLEKMRLMGLQWLRCNNPLFTKWTAVQPCKDVWQFPDEFVNRFTKAGLSILGNLDRTPLWNARNPTNVRNTDFMDYKADLPADLGSWRLYASNMAARYRDRIRYWEIWNEPDITFLRPPPGMTHAEAYKLLVAEARAALRAVDPGLKLVGGPAYFFYKRSSYENCQEDFTERLIENGGLALLDVFGYHYYLKERRLLDASSEPAKKLDVMRAAFAKVGKSPVLWDTEGGLIQFTASALDLEIPASKLSIDEAADELVWWHVSQLAAGVEKVFWYDGQDNFFYHFHVTKNLFDYREPRPAAVALALMTWLLDGRHAVEARALEGGRLVRFSGPTGPVSLAWALPGKTSRLVPEVGQRSFDTLARPVALSGGALVLTEKPVYLVGEPEARVLMGVGR